MNAAGSSGVVREPAFDRGRDRSTGSNGERWMVRGFWTAFASFAVLVVAATPLAGRPDGTTIPGEAGDTTVVQAPALCATLPDCHSGPTNTLNMIGGVQITGAPEGPYEPGRPYDLGLSITGNFFTRRYGFQLAAFFEDDQTSAGTFQTMTPDTVAFDFQGQQLLTHKEPLQSGQVAFRWIAPAEARGPVVLRVASNSANGDNSEGGDHINTAELLLTPAATPPLDPFFFPQIGAGSQGGLRFTTELVFVNSGETSALAVDLLDSSGAPFAAEIVMGDQVLPQQSSFETQLARGQALKLLLTSSGGIRAGYARVTAAPSVGGTAVFTLTDSASGIVRYEAGVPASRPLQEFSLAVDIDPLAGSDTGLALVNPAAGAGEAPAGGTEAAVTLRLYDPDFQLQGEESLTLNPGQHLPRFVSQLFEGPISMFGEEAFRGSVTVQSDQPLAAVTLRQTLVPTLTAFPVIPGRADAP